jgi:hypothetical protein
MMPKTLSTKSKLIPKRAKELNVIYFLDSNKTKSFKITMVQLRFAIAGVVIVGLWSASSFSFLTYQVSKNNRLERRLETAMDHVFEYQTRFESVYEKAYPADKYHPTTAAGQSAFPGSGVVRSGDDTGSEGVDDSIPDDSVAAASASGQAEKTKATVEQTKSVRQGATASAPTPASGTQSVRIDSPNMLNEQGQLSFRFSLKNADPTSKAEGVLFGIARFESPDGSITYVGAPANVRPDSNGLAQSPHEGFRFGIKFHKPKKLTFAPPPSKQGTFTEVRIYLQKTKGGDFDSVYQVDEQVQKQLAASISIPPVQQPAAKPLIRSQSRAEVMPRSETAPARAEAVSQPPEEKADAMEYKNESFADDQDFDGE